MHRVFKVFMVLLVLFLFSMQINFQKQSRQIEAKPHVLEDLKRKREDNFRKSSSDASTRSCEIEISKRTRNKKAKKEKAKRQKYQMLWKIH